MSRIAAGGRHTCVVTSAGGVKCWGSNEYGQLGDGRTTDSFIPVDVVGLASGVRAISAGGSHTCAITGAGELKCWGANGSGQLGNGGTTDSGLPVDVRGLAGGVSAIAAGGAHTCAVTSSGGARCWGANDYMQLGSGSSTGSSVAVPVSGLGAGVAAVAAGDIHTCALTTGGAVECWGYAGSGGLGGAVPGAVPGLASGVAAIAARYEQTCALTTRGAILCWGGFEGGGPTDIFPGLDTEFEAISAGFGQTCALTSGGAVTCWGGPSGSGPTDIAGLADGVVTIAAGGSHACAITSGGAVQCWGENWNGQLGNGRTCDTLSGSSAPVTVDFTPQPATEPTGAPGARIDHATGPADVVLRYDLGPNVGVGELEGEVFNPGPEFTLFGDGTVIFQSDLTQLPPADRPIVRARPFMIARLDENQVQSLLRYALGEGGLADACENYPTQDTDVSESHILTVRTGGVAKRVNVGGPSPLGPLLESLGNYDPGSGVPTGVWVPNRYWGNLFEAGNAIEIGLLPDPRQAGSAAWPWPDIAPGDFVGRDEGGWIGAPRRVMSVKEAAVLGLSKNGGVVKRIYLVGPDRKTIYSFSLWPMLPDEAG